MTLQWHFVATVLYIEIFLVTLLLLPFISPKTWQRLFRSRIAQMFTAYSNLYFNIFIAILVLLFLESIREVRKYSEPVQETAASIGAETLQHMKLFRAQRNLYISGFALFLWIILRRLVLLIATEATLMAQSEASMRQAQGAAAAAQQLMAEKDHSDENKKNKAAEEKEKVDQTHVEKELAQTQAELEKTKEELYRAKVEFSTIKKQAESTNAEYDRLLEEHAQLQRKLATLEGEEDDDKKGK